MAVEALGGEWVEVAALGVALGAGGLGRGGAFVAGLVAGAAGPVVAEAPRLVLAGALAAGHGSAQEPGRLALPALVRLIRRTGDAFGVAVALEDLFDSRFGLVGGCVEALDPGWHSRLPPAA